MTDFLLWLIGRSDDDRPFGFVVVCFVPLVPRLVLLFRFWEQRWKLLTKHQQHAEEHRTHILSMMGFSFSALLGVTIADSAVTANLAGISAFLLVSFVAFDASLRIQSYKHFRWLDQASITLLDLGNLALLAALMNALSIAAVEVWQLWMSAVLLGIVWLTDYVHRFIIDWRFFREDGRV